jgi:hypothetical protein
MGRTAEACHQIDTARQPKMLVADSKKQADDIVIWFVIYFTLI